eukprot:15343136-Ditylum_brightwellii.AAC.1
MLGVRKAATLTEKAELEHLHKKTNRYLKAVTACPLKPHKVWVSYMAILNGSLNYSLMTTSFTEKE